MEIDIAPTEKFRLGYQPSLDGLRGIAVLSVLVFHAYVPITLPWIRSNVILGVGGFIGVDIFFVLSGFLITTLLFEEYERNGKIHFKSFYIRRALRLIPALLVFLSACLLTAAIFQTKETALIALKDSLIVIFYSSNYVAVGTHSLRHTWSLAVEEQFYTIYPALFVLLFFAVRKFNANRKWILLGLAAGVVAIAVQRANLFELYADSARVYQGLDTRADSLLLGCITGFLVSWNLIRNQVWFLKSLKILASLALGFLFYTGMTAHIKAPYLYYGGFTIISIAVSILIMALVSNPPGILLFILESRLLTWIGRISYGMYLWHGLTYFFLNRLIPYVPDISPTLNLMVIPLMSKIVITIVISALSFFLIERPFLRLKKRLIIQPGKKEMQPLSSTQPQEAT